MDGAPSSLSNATIGVVRFAFARQIVASVARSTGPLSARLRANPSVLAWLCRTSGAVLRVLGRRLALERRQRRSACQACGDPF
jgi:threonine/homoserine/homoserine lactone efflux protein